ncbi:hypothetical protein ACQP0C_17665 [Nocardia sp. CA-129566]|uniref:hypothetical protein n=1 Tax=Nocardia sp. CA-129566 TaxID=3239976 RepID=UPI003D975AC9
MDTDHRVKHLEMLQSVIARLSQQSFTVRGWSVTLVSVVLAIVTAQSRPSSALILLAIAPTWIFWGLDGYYLSLERRYRALFVAAAQQLRAPVPTGPRPFDMIPDSGRAFRDFARAILSPGVAAIPAVLTALIVGYWIVATFMS